MAARAADTRIKILRSYVLSAIQNNPSETGKLQLEQHSGRRHHRRDSDGAATVVAAVASGTNPDADLAEMLCCDSKVVFNK